MFEKAVKAFLKSKVCVGRAEACGALIGAPQIQRDRDFVPFFKSSSQSPFD
jgi:hypothetical protein